MLAEMGVDTGVDLPKLLEAGGRAEAILGQRLRSNTLRSGPAIHVPSAADKETDAAIETR